MTSPLLKVFTPITSTCIDVLAQFNQIVFKNYFYTVDELGNHLEVLLVISTNYLIVSQNIQGQTINYFCPANFDVKFQVLRRQWPNEKTPGLAIGVRFEKEPNNLATDFYHNNPAIIQQLVSVLSKKINQRNFHKLFKAKKKVGKGAFATVYLAERLVDGKMVAVKAFSKQKQFSGDKGKQSLENQIRIMRMVDHPNASTLQQVYQSNNSIYVILEYFEGRQLNDQIRTGRKFTQQQTTIILKQILLALQHLDKKRIIHRDLKPQNIMFKYQNSLEIAICDFGLATPADEGTYLFVRCGTPGFVAPQIINIKDMTTKSQPISDVFSAGVIFHILLFGDSIFTGKNYNDVLAQNRLCEFDFQAQKYQALPKNLLNLLISMLQKDPKKRISAQRALASEVFQANYYNKYLSTQMDVEQQISIPQKQNMPLNQMNLNQINLFKNNNKSLGQKMDDQNEKRNSQSIGQSVKKKLSFMGNPNFRTAERKD